MQCYCTIITLVDSYQKVSVKNIKLVRFMQIVKCTEYINDLYNDDTLWLPPYKDVHRKNIVTNFWHWSTSIIHLFL